MPKQGELFATADVARELGVHRMHVRRLVSSGQLSLFARTPGGQMLFDPDVVHQLARRRGAQRWVFRRDREWRAHGEAWQALETIRVRMAKAKIERASIDASPVERASKKAGVA